MMPQTKSIIGALSLSFVVFYVGTSSVGCASIAKGTTQSITVSSNVDGAEIFLEGEKIGTTPFTGMVKKNKEQLRLEAAGYRPETIVLSKSLEPIFWGNIIIGGTLGSLTDFATGAAYQYAPASYQVELRAEGQSDADYQRTLGVRKFGMIYIDEISGDIAGGGGQYLDALITLSQTADGTPVLNYQEIRSALEGSRGDQVRFGNLLINLM